MIMKFESGIILSDLLKFLKHKEKFLYSDSNTYLL